ncbi:MAG: aldehyde dehydrogenase family protein [Myxococcales bacterium]|nr:aldehyde dehydrogenase family protein [Myxococcales bacterium]MCB9532387.1 aldehyde dehydrogenase family protein [Myxococcales bacterium]
MTDRWTASLWTTSSRGQFVDGRWAHGGEPTFESRAPFDTRHVVGAFESGLAALDGAVASARRARVGWAASGLPDRIAAVRAFADALDAREPELVRGIVTEVGKPVAFARAEVRALRAKIELLVGRAPMELVGERLSGGAGYWEPCPLGVFAVLGPFNFPVHLSNGHVVAALLGGNAVILKPSEVAPGCGQLYVEAWEAAARAVGAPPGVLSLLQGGGDVGAALAAHDGIDAVAFTGSYAVGVALRRATAHQPGKLLALEMGGKNTAIVLGDADVDAAAAAVVGAAYGMSGQRCTATSRVVVARSVAAPLIAALERGVRRLVLGDPFDVRTDLGPLATDAARARFVAAQGTLDGLRAVVDGGEAEGPAPGWWVRPALHEVVDRAAARARTSEELFGPEVVVDVIDDDDEAVHVANATPYGLAMSVHCATEARFEALRRRLDAGLVNWNRGTAGASGALPFGGVKRSGNHRPAGSWSLRYCVRPVAVLRGDGSE